MLTEAEWKALTRLYAAGARGAEYDGVSYGDAGAWATLIQLRQHEPPLAREITRMDPAHRTMHYLVIITEAGERYYERNRRLYNALYAEAPRPNDGREGSC
jgi:hypothetical protein